MKMVFSFGTSDKKIVRDTAEICEDEELIFGEEIKKIKRKCKNRVFQVLETLYPKILFLGNDKY